MSWGGCVIMADACKVLWNCVIPLELLISERMIILFRTSYLHSWRNSSLQSVEVVVWQLVTAGDSSLGWSQQPPAVTAASTDQARWVTVYCDIRVTSAVTTVECDTEWLSLEWHHTESHQSLSLVSAPECDSVCRGQYHWGLRILSSVVTRVSHDGWSSPATLLSLHCHITSVVKETVRDFRKHSDWWEFKWWKNKCGNFAGMRWKIENILWRQWEGLNYILRDCDV